MKQTIFTGCGTALVTPMKDDLSVDYPRLQELIENQIAAGVDAIVVNGTTGECATLSDDEQYKITLVAKETIAGRVPLIAGAGSNDTAHAVRLAMSARNAGADAILVVTPYYNKTSQQGLVEHYNRIANHACLPMILYNVPSRTGMNIAPETCAILAENEYIYAVKEASGNIAQVARIRDLCGDALEVYSGGDEYIVPILSLGGKGIISVLSNVVPEEVHQMCVDYFAGETAKAARKQILLMPLIDALFSDVNPIPVKEAMWLIGFNVGECRAPLCRMESRKAEHLEEILRKYMLIP
ncbi:MAG TPA: 4-hydroxy-tetrahydrodipicolinate synthase [Oscillospiraceae bacterium]|jgi:4-hydroxy-tetrahydrodipicolinate synthase|nr:4-hydroxy-tetrahydrodipicolinate synthase [Oscillospiraceae bacterium]HRW57694.1 4-hydroxy-tetrahydrodipicolinate synthase [Oscillospiraceae bacterium]